MKNIDVVDIATLPWLTGSEVFATMEPAFRDNLSSHGDASSVENLLSRYSIRSLWLDPNSTRRIDYVRVESGYEDLCEAYHHSVEEAYFLSGEAELSAEGTFKAGDYFWRPPGWVHSASSSQGYDAIVTLEGDYASEGSGRVTRVACADELAGEQVLPPDQIDRIGPRGYVRHAEGRFMVWHESDPILCRAMSAKDGQLRSRYLSRNAQTGALTALVKIPEGWTAGSEVSERERFLIVAEGRVAVDGQYLGEGSLVRVGAGEVIPTLHCDSSTQLLVKVGEASL